MFEDDFLGDERTRSNLEATAEALRQLFGVAGERCPDIVWLLEGTLPGLFPQFAVVPRPNAALPRNLAVTHFEPPRIEIRESIWRAAGSGHPRARHVAFHELAHIAIHERMPKSLKDGRQERKLLSAIQRNMSVEIQADDLAFYLMLPRRLVEQCESLAEIVNGFRVPYKLALEAKRQYGLHHFRKLLPYEVADLMMAEDEPF